MEETDQS